MEGTSEFWNELYMALEERWVEMGQDVAELENMRGQIYHEMDKIAEALDEQWEQRKITVQDVNRDVWEYMGVEHGSK